MCGVFGFVSYDGKGPDLKTLAKIAKATMTRGPHAFGFAWLDWSGRLKMFKQTGRIVDHLNLLAMARTARVLVGHCRWATHGSPKNNLNNHPHPADGGWIVHNGIVTNHEELAAEYDLYPVTECDSEVLGLLIAHGSGSLVKRCRATAEEARGRVTMLGVWGHPARMVAVRADNPLSVGTIRDGERFYLGSLRDDLPGKVTAVPNNSGLDFGPGAVTAFKVARPAAPASLFE
jgi:glucosamine 6-phosphate synthetase-like amidotransferase/phosphosugar isomerase protein